MIFWMAALLFIVGAVCTAVFIKRYRESKSVRFLAFAVIAFLFSLVFAGYVTLTFIFLNGIT